MQGTLRSSDADDPAKLAETLQKISKNLDVSLAPRCPE
jgi:hypothetical protein